MKKLIVLLMISVGSLTAQAAACDIEQTSDGRYGVREYRASGWVYIVRGLSYSEAVKALGRLQSSGRCN